MDGVLVGGLPAGRTCLIAGPPGTGKTTLGNQMAFKHAASGGSVIYATLHSETHDLMLHNLRDFDFFDPSIPGDRIHYLNLLSSLQEDGVNGVLRTLGRELHGSSATLLVVDSTTIVGDMDFTIVDLRNFARQIEAQAAMLGCTTVLLTSEYQDQLQHLAAHVNGVILLSNERVESRRVRMLEVVKLRGANHTAGAHEFSITREGVKVYPRLETLAGWERPAQSQSERLGTGVEGLDAMLGGGLIPVSSTLLLGTPGAGKTAVGLSFLDEGARRGELGLVTGFHESATEMANTGKGIGLDIGRHIEAGFIRVLWEPPLDVSADAWAWRLLEEVDEHQPRRVFIDAITDVQRFITSPLRFASFLTALTNELRTRGVTSLVGAELGTYVDETLSMPVPSASAMVDNGILLRHVEVRSELRRIVSILKARQAPTDPVIRELLIGDGGISVSEPFVDVSGLLTGSPTSRRRPEGQDVVL